VFNHLESFDDLYNSSDSITEVYSAIVDRLVSEAAEHGTIAYLVPGSPLVAEHTVELLRRRTEIKLEILPGISFLDLAWDRLNVDPVESRVTIVDGQQFESEIAHLTGPVLVAQCDDQFVLSDIKLSLDVDDAPMVTVLQRLGSTSEAVFEIEWAELDRGFDPDHLTSLWIPQIPKFRPGDAMTELHELVRRLRAECPWDREQTHSSLIPYLIEETTEVVEAIEQMNDGDRPIDGLIEELGDLLFQVMIHSAIAEEDGLFDLTDVANGIRDKMIRRHPHVFDRDPRTPMPNREQLVAQWAAIKATERNKG
jgi:tetrapyrrole methylase family protein/MazG family protein